MKSTVSRFTPLSLLKTLGAISAVLCVSQSVHANATADFSQGTGTTNPSHQFVGAIGDGWITPWTTFSLNTDFTANVTNTNPIRGNDNYLKVGIDAGDTAARRSSVYRGFNTALASSAHTISFTLRADDLTGWNNGDFFGIFTGSSAKTSTTSDAGQTWGILIQGGTPAITLRAGESGAGSSVNTGLTFVAGISYSFILNIDPEAKSWQAIISDGTTTFTSGTLGYRSQTNVGSYIHFNTLQNSGADNWGYSLDGLNVVQVPESSTVVLILAMAAAVSVPLLRKRSRR